MTRKISKPNSRNRWEDHYTRKARKENFPARSVYKLQEMQKRYRLIHPGNRVLDLGCAPGSWLKYAAQITGPRGFVLGLDLKPVNLELPGHAQAIVADIFDLSDDVNANAAAEISLHPQRHGTGHHRPSGRGRRPVGDPL